MDAEEAQGAREAPGCDSEAHQLRTETEGGLTAAVACVAAMYARSEGPGLTAFSDGGERPVAERLALLPRIPKRRGASKGEKRLQTIPELEEELLAEAVEGPAVDAVTEARLLGEPLPEALPMAVDDALEVRSEAAVEELMSTVAGQQTEATPPRNRRGVRPEPIGREGTLETSDPLPPPSASVPEENWDADPPQSAAQLLQGMRERDPAFGGVARIRPNRDPARSIPPAGYREDEIRQEEEARAGTGRKKKKKKSKGMNLRKENFVSMLFDAEPVGCVRAVTAEAPIASSVVAASAPPPAESVRDAAAEAPVAPQPVAVSAPPPARPVLRATRGVSRTVRDEGSRPKPKPKPAPPKREGESGEPKNKRGCGKWLTSDGCRKRGSQFGGLVPVALDRSVDPPPYACFNCGNRGHTMKHCPESWRGTVCYNCGRRGMTMRTCDRCSLAHRAFLAERKEKSLLQSRATAPPTAPSTTMAVPPPEPMEVAEEKEGPKRKTRRSKRKGKAPSLPSTPTPSGAAVVAASTSAAATSTPSGSVQEIGGSSGARQAVIDELLGGLPAPLRDEVHLAWREMGLCSSAPLAESQPGEEPD